MTKRSERSERLRVVNLVHHHPRGGWGKIWGPDVSRCLLRRGDTIVREVETDTKLSIRQHPRHTTPKDTKNCTHPVRAPFSPVDRNSPIRSSKIIVRTRLIVKLFLIPLILSDPTNFDHRIYRQVARKVWLRRNIKGRFYVSLTLPRSFSKSQSFMSPP